MRNDKHLAIELRKKGLSYNKISKKLNIPKSTMSYWFKNESWSEELRKELSRKALFVAKKRLRLINKERKEKWEKWRESHREVARKEFNSLKDNQLFLAGLMLYWGEGDSKIENCLVRLSNTDPEMIRIFSLFLRKILDVPKDRIKINLILYPDLDDKKCKDFWSEYSEIPKETFYKTQFIKGRHPTKRLSYGICSISTCSRALKEKVFVWLGLFKEELKLCGSSSAVECNIANVEIAGANPVSRSKINDLGALTY